MSNNVLCMFIDLNIDKCVCIYILVYIFVSFCMYVYIYIYIHTYVFVITYVHIFASIIYQYICMYKYHTYINIDKALGQSTIFDKS